MLGMTHGVCSGTFTFSPVTLAGYVCKNSVHCMLGSIEQGKCNYLLLTKLFVSCHVGTEAAIAAYVLSEPASLQA